MKPLALTAIRSLRVPSLPLHPSLYLHRASHGLTTQSIGISAQTATGAQLHRPPVVRTFTLSSVLRHGSATPGKPGNHLGVGRGGSAVLENKHTSENGTLTAPPIVISPGGWGSGSNIIDAFMTTAFGLTMVFFGGVAYVEWYKDKVLKKMEQAFSAGYDPALELANRSVQRHVFSKESLQDRQQVASTGEDDPTEWWDTPPMRRDEQDTLDRIVQGKESGRYYMILGPKGTGKTTMLLTSMREIHAEGASVCDAHPDLEVFRLRLGKALNYEYHEDSQTGLFQRRDPREGGPALDIERAMNKLEKVALRYSQRMGRPLVLIFNNIHFFRNDDAGRDILLQLQQHAEAWAESGIVTTVFSSDDAWPYMTMRKSASRMRVVSVKDLKPHQAWHAARQIRLARTHHSHPPSPSTSTSTSPSASPSLSTSPATPATDATSDIYKHLVSLVGGRLSYLVQAALHGDMLSHARQMVDTEREWLQSQIGLIEDCDDDVMDEQKWSSCSWLLLREFVKIRQEQEKETQEKIEAGELPADALHDLPLPSVPYHRARQVMTRTDFLEELDRSNIIAIDIHHTVTPDSLLLLRAAREVVEEDGFDDVLDSVRDRIDEIESLHRTRELTFKDVKAGDRIRLTVDKGGAVLVES